MDYARVSAACELLADKLELLESVTQTLGKHPRGHGRAVVQSVAELAAATDYSAWGVAKESDLPRVVIDARELAFSIAAAFDVCHLFADRHGIVNQNGFTLRTRSRVPDEAAAVATMDAKPDDWRPYIEDDWPVGLRGAAQRVRYAYADAKRLAIPIVRITSQSSSIEWEGVRYPVTFGWCNAFTAMIEAKGAPIGISTHVGKPSEAVAKLPLELRAILSSRGKQGYYLTIFQ